MNEMALASGHWNDDSALLAAASNRQQSMLLLNLLFIGGVAAVNALIYCTIKIHSPILIRHAAAAPPPSAATTINKIIKAENSVSL